jgi:Putative phage tail protein
VQALLEFYGFTRGATDLLAGIVPGYVVERPMSARDALQPLSLAYFFDAIESGDEVAFRHRGREPAVALFDDGAMVETNPDTPLATLTRLQETDLPASAKVNYVSGSTNYAQAVSEGRRLIGASGRLARAELPIVMEADQAAAVAESWLFEAWASRERATFTAPPSALALESGDIVEMLIDGATRSFRIVEIADSGSRSIEALSIDPEIYTLVPAPARERRITSEVASGAPEVAFLDLPLFDGSESGAAGYIAAIQEPWPGTLALYGSPEASGFRLRALIPGVSIMGRTLSTLPRGPVSRFDYATKLQLEVAGGELASVTRTQMLAGANAAAVEGLDGSWEVFQFETAELISSGVYEVSGLLRGQAGSESSMAKVDMPIAAGATFVLLNSSVALIDLSVDEIKLPYQWRYGPASRDLSDVSYGQNEHAFAGLGLRPLSPVHVRGSRNSNGDLSLSWIRRTRVGGDSWDTLEVPLAEDFERYEVDVLADDESVIRTLVTETASADYTAAEQIADFGQLRNPCPVRIVQLSAIFGRGSATLAFL